MYVTEWDEQMLVEQEQRVAMERGPFELAKLRARVRARALRDEANAERLLSDRNDRKGQHARSFENFVCRVANEWLRQGVLA